MFVALLLLEILYVIWFIYDILILPLDDPSVTTNTWIQEILNLMFVLLIVQETEGAQFPQINAWINDDDAE